MPLLSDNLLAEFVTTAPQQDLYDSAWKGSGSFGLRVNRGKGTKRFFILYSIRGKRRRFFLGDYPRLGVAEARAKATQVIEQVKFGSDPASKLSKLKTEGGFDEVALRFLKQGKFSPKTFDEYERIINKELLPHLATRLVSQISEREIRALLFSISENRPTLSNRVRAVLLGIFSSAVEAGLCDRNLIAGIRPTSKEAVNRKPRGGKIIELEQLQTIYLDSQELPAASKALVQFTLLSGVSVRLVQQLVWSEIRGDYWITKTGQTIFLTPLHKELMNINSKNSHFIFSPDGGTTPFKNPRVILQRLRKPEQPLASWSDLVSNIKNQMLKLGFVYADLALVFGLGRNTGLESPDTNSVQRSAKRVFTDWSLIISGQPIESGGASNVIRMRRLKRLK